MKKSTTPSLRSVHFSVYKTLRPYKRIIFPLADFGLSIISVAIAFLLRFDGHIPPEYYQTFPYFSILIGLLNIGSFFTFKLYSFVWDFVGLHELKKLFYSAAASHVILSFLVLIGWDITYIFAGFPRSVIFINFFLTFSLVGGLRIAKRLLKEIFHSSPGEDSEATLIVGAGPEAEQLVRSLMRRKSVYFPIGLVSEHEKQRAIVVHGLRVLGTIDQMAEIISDHKVKRVVIALSAADGSTIRNAVTKAREAGVTHVRIIPDTYEMLIGKNTMTELREVQIEDVLGRSPALLDTDAMEKHFRDKIVFISGAAGSIGAELCRQILSFKPSKLLAVDFNESGIFDLMGELGALNQHTEIVPIIASITDRSKIENLLSRYKPHTVFHAAAYKHVPLMEEFPEEAITTNVLGTYNLAHASLNAGVETFVMISTDKAIRPRSVMGKTKRAAELVVQSCNLHNKTKFIAVRFGNVIGSRGSVIPLFQEQIRKRIPVTVTHPDMTRYFMTIREAALLVAEAGAIGKGGEIFMLDMGKPVRILDVARELIRLYGLEPDKDVPIVFTGTRPGEKIVEEIFSDDEKLIGQTQWEKIHIIKTNHSISEHSVETFVKEVTASPSLEKLNEFITEHA